jgi:hypothetical protein
MQYESKVALEAYDREGFVYCPPSPDAALVGLSSPPLLNMLSVILDNKAAVSSVGSQW